MVGGGGASGQVAIDSWVNLGGNEFARAEAGASVSSNSSNRGRGGELQRALGTGLFLVVALARMAYLEG